MDDEGRIAMIRAGLPSQLPKHPGLDASVDHAPVRKQVLSSQEERLALENALRYFPESNHSTLGPEFLKELRTYGRIYMYRFRPDCVIRALPIDQYQAHSLQAAGIMLMIDNNLDPVIAQFPNELITYGGNGAVFQNWAQYVLVMNYLSQMTDEQTLVIYSGHPLGLFPSNKNAPRVVVTNGMMIPNYSSVDHYERLNAMGVTQYGQMTAGSYMYIGPQGIVHGTTITLMNAARMKFGIPANGDLGGLCFVTSGLGGMSGAQAKAAVIAGVSCIVAESNPIAARKRHSQGWVEQISENVDEAIDLMLESATNKVGTSIGFIGNIVELWERLVERDVMVHLGSDQTSLHNPYQGGYYPANLSFEESQELMHTNPSEFKSAVQSTLQRHVLAINSMTKKGMFFWDYGNAFLLEAGRAKADIFDDNGDYKYPSYVEDIMGPLCFDRGFGPFRWVCSSGLANDLQATDKIAFETLSELYDLVTDEDVKQQIRDNLKWIKEADSHQLVVGSQARILYADEQGRNAIATKFNEAIADGRISAPVILGRDHHDVSGTDSPYRETANIQDGSKWTADMAVQNFIGDAIRGATWVSLHNGGGVGWGEVMNGGFGMVIDGSEDSKTRLQSMLHWDVNNGVARRAWARNSGAVSSIKEAMKINTSLQVTLPNSVDENLLEHIFNGE
ncbi:urocanate hydratase [Candidatus Poseidoniales archaeon]|nr:urocanate hydratase [Candidatus Poseidoniales archaeon]|tara:strand:+ start:3115 stop:5139 length:2025 start_codon:yes stop_codon:yes gene_type:complete